MLEKVDERCLAGTTGSDHEDVERCGIFAPADLQPVSDVMDCAGRKHTRLGLFNVLTVLGA